MSINARIQSAIYRSRDDLVGAHDTIVDATLARMFGEVLALVNEALTSTADNAAAVANPTAYQVGDVIRVIHDDGTYHVTVTERFIEGGEFLWRGNAENGRTMTGSDDMIVSYTRKV